MKALHRCIKFLIDIKRQRAKIIEKKDIRFHLMSIFISEKGLKKFPLIKKIKFKYKREYHSKG